MSISSISLTPDQLQTSEGVRILNEALEKLSNLVPGDGEEVKILNGFGSPEGQLAAKVGSIYLRKDGGSATTVYMKEAGTGATGWVGIANTTSLEGLVKNSIELDGTSAQLKNDEDSPGNSEYYGTDSSGDKGYHSLSEVLSEDDVWGLILIGNMIFNKEE